MKQTANKMYRCLVFNKPMGVLTRFTDKDERPNLSHYIRVPNVYPVGRLDKDSEGLLLLTDRGSFVEPLLKPGGKSKTYLVCVEGSPRPEQLQHLAQGPRLKDGPSLAVGVEMLEKAPDWLWEREPPIRVRKSIPVSWLRLTLREGRNRQVRRMTAAVGLPTLRLIRTGFGVFQLGELEPGAWREASPQEKAYLDSLPATPQTSPRRPKKRRRNKKKLP